MSDISDNLRLILEKVIGVKPGQNLLVITNPYARAKTVAYLVTELASSMGIQAVLVMMEVRTHAGQEPPPAIAEAMKTTDFIFEISEMGALGHTTARKEASERGVKYYLMPMETSEYYLKNMVSFEALEAMKVRTEKLAEIMSHSSIARLTTSYGTDITMSLKGRKAIPIHPLVDAIIPDYGETAISPVEGTTDGVVVADGSVRGWGYVLRKPIRFEVRKGKALVDTISCEDAEQAERFKKLLLLDANATNCAAELGLGTSRTVSKMLHGSFASDYAIAGTFHIACGRNNDIGGRTLSTIHQDVLMTGGNVKLDDVYVVENGELKV